MKQLKELVAVGVVMLTSSTFFACTQDGEFKKTENGLKYKIHSTHQGKKPQMGDMLTLSMTYKTDKDSLLWSSYKMGKPVKMPLMAPTFKGGIEEGFAMLAEGDSGTFVVSADSLFEKTFMAKLPPFINKGSFLTFDVKMEKIQTKEEVENEMKAQIEKGMKEEKQNMDEYLQKNNVKEKPTTSGLYYIPTVVGKGSQADSGKTVSVHYTGKLLNGKVFDSSVESKREPIQFQLGAGRVIPGWDEGIRKMKVGGKATLIIPSNLAYGQRGAPGQQAGEYIIPPFSPLVFEVELMDVK